MRGAKRSGNAGWHPRRQRRAGDPNLTEFSIAKHRNGRTGTVKLFFQPQFTKFLNYMDNRDRTGQQLVGGGVRFHF